MELRLAVLETMALLRRNCAAAPIRCELLTAHILTAPTSAPHQRLPCRVHHRRQVDSKSVLVRKLRPLTRLAPRRPR